MLNKLLSIVRQPLGRSPKVACAGEQAQQAPNQVSTRPRRPTPSPGTPVYPPMDYGIGYDPIDIVLSAQAELIGRLRLLTGVGDVQFDRLYLSVIKNLAQHINQLPASETGTHNGPGGLFRLCVEIGFYSLQVSEGVVFSGRESVELRRELEPRWRYATFLAGLCVELHRPLTSMVVVTDEGKEWPAFQVSLGAWLHNEGVDRFFIRWQGSEAAAAAKGQGAASYMVYKIIPEENLQYLHQMSSKIVPSMLDAIMGSTQPGDIAPMFKIIADVRSKVMKRDEAIRPANYGKATLGVHIEPFLLDAMRRLVKDGIWKINEKRARLWYGTDGLFLVWKTAAKEILELLKADGVSGIPQDSQTLLEMLQQQKVFALDKDGSPYWTILPPTSNSELVAVKFTNPLTVLGDLYEEAAPVGPLATQPVHETARVSEQVISPVSTVPAAVPEPQPETVEPDGNAKESRAEYSKSEVLPASLDATKESEAGEIPADLQRLFTPLTRDVLGELMGEHKAGVTRGETGPHEHGFAIGLERLASYGADPTKVIDELNKAGWLYTPPEKPGKKIHQAKLNNKAMQVIIIKQTAAQDAGFLK